MTGWQIIVGLENGTLIRESPSARPYPTVTVRQILASGEDVEAVWAGLPASARAKLVTQYFPEE